MTEYKFVKVDKFEGMCIVTLNNPKNLNALSNEMLEDLIGIIKTLENDNSIRVVIITGEGRAFVAGGDILGMSTMSSKEAEEFSAYTVSLYKFMRDSDKIFIGAINGYALGGGCELALTCDLRIASKNSKFALPEVSLGIIPGALGTQQLPRLIGKQRAMELILTGDIISAEKACELGIILEVVEEEVLLEKSKELALRILKNAPIAVGNAKKSIQQTEENNFGEGVEFEKKMFGQCFDTKDQKEGMKAFLEKRNPQYRGW